MAPVEPLELLRDWLRRQLPSEAADWLEAQAIASRGATDRNLFLAISLVHRRIGKADLTCPRKTRRRQKLQGRAGVRPVGAWIRRHGYFSCSQQAVRLIALSRASSNYLQRRTSAS
jgi:hypothetical protein